MTMRLTLAYGGGDPAAITDPGDAVIFPELVTGSYAALRAGGGGIRVDDPSLRAFRTFSRTAHTTCIAGTVPLSDGRGRMTNTAFVFRNGRTIHRYDKIHLFRPAGDDRYFSGGTSFGVFTFPAGRVRVRAAVIICYDLRFPELVRFLAREGAVVLFVPARWPLVRDEAWHALLRARAIENQILVVGCNARGPEGGISYVCGPSGETMFTSNDMPEADHHTIELDLGCIAAVRQRVRYLDDAVLLRALAVPRAFRSSRRVRDAPGAGR